jgi:hypothetical protein
LDVRALFVAHDESRLAAVNKMRGLWAETAQQFAECQRRLCDEPVG